MQSKPGESDSMFMPSMTSPVEINTAAHLFNPILRKAAPSLARSTSTTLVKHGRQTMKTRVGNWNIKTEINARRSEAVPKDATVKGRVVDEEPPASARKPGDPFTTRPTPSKEGRRKYS
jgi:hypothetical protein